MVHRLITDLAVFDFTPNGMELVELADGVTLEELKENTEAKFNSTSFAIK